MSAEATDRYTMASCRYLLKCAGRGVPRGETAETMAEFIAVHLAALHQVKQRWGKAALVLELGRSAKKFVVKPPNGGSGDPRNEPLMQEAKEIFQGTWVENQAKLFK